MDAVLLNDVIPILRCVLRIMRAVLRPYVIMSSANVIIYEDAVYVRLEAVTVLSSVLTTVLRTVSDANVRIRYRLRVTAVGINSLDHLVCQGLRHLAILNGDDGEEDDGVDTLCSRLLFRLEVALNDPERVLARGRLSYCRMLTL